MLDDPLWQYIRNRLVEYYKKNPNKVFLIKESTATFPTFLFPPQPFGEHTKVQCIEMRKPNNDASAFVKQVSPRKEDFADLNLWSKMGKTEEEITTIPSSDLRRVLCAIDSTSIQFLYPINIPFNLSLAGHKVCVEKPKRQAWLLVYLPKQLIPPEMSEQNYSLNIQHVKDKKTEFIRNFGTFLKIPDYRLVLRKIQKISIEHFSETVSPDL